jgi:type IV fimbrial biogenesis protein FimT
VGPPGAVIAFDGRGRRRAVADQTLVLSPDACKAGESKSTLTINNPARSGDQGTCS